MVVAGCDGPHAEGRHADERVAVLGKMDDRRRETCAVGIGEQDREARFHHADERVRRPEVNTDNVVIHCKILAAIARVVILGERQRCGSS